MSLQNTYKMIAYLNHEMGDKPTAAMLLVFLTLVMSKGDIHRSEVLRKTKVPESTLSRIVTRLSQVNRKGERGLDWIIETYDPTDTRYKIMRLTPKGEKIKQKVLEILEEKQ